MDDLFHLDRKGLSPFAELLKRRGQEPVVLLINGLSACGAWSRLLVYFPFIQYSAGGAKMGAVL